MIELQHIHRQFVVGGQIVHALNDINLHIAAGEYVSVMGPSGSGKSTLLNIIALLDQPTSGRYLLDGRDVTQLADNTLAQIRRENIGFVFQFFHLIPRLSAAENVEMPMLLAGVGIKERRERVREALANVALSGRAEHRPNQLSGGERQRVAIARATIMHPKVLLADEPTGNLDSVSGLEIFQVLEKLHAQGMTLVIITHDANLGRRAVRHIHMIDGRIGQ